ncbi:hypothetical protein EZV73_05955 [Acidaminobacter sp. JC074]|nr:hypothetical protein [Acidaminobacter sp. JC074]
MLQEGDTLTIIPLIAGG